MNDMSRHRVAKRGVPYTVPVVPETAKDPR
jgi:hypothetical protein